MTAKDVAELMKLHPNKDYEFIRANLDFYGNYEFIGKDGKTRKFAELDDDKLKIVLEVSDNFRYRIASEKLLYYRNLLKEVEK